MNFLIDIPEYIIGTFLIVASLRVGGLELTYNTNTSHRQNVMLELFKKNHTRKISVNKGEKLALFMTIDEGTEYFKTRFEKLKN